MVWEGVCFGRGCAKEQSQCLRDTEAPRVCVPPARAGPDCPASFRALPSSLLLGLPPAVSNTCRCSHQARSAHSIRGRHTSSTSWNAGQAARDGATAWDRPAARATLKPGGRRADAVPSAGGFDEASHLGPLRADLCARPYVPKTGAAGSKVMHGLGRVPAARSSEGGPG